MMKMTFFHLLMRQSFLPILTAIGFSCVGRSADYVETQTIALRQGWNAVSLRLDPLEPRPGDVFTNLPVDKVATYIRTRTPVEFVQDPAGQPWKQKGWRAWFAPALPEAVATDLYTIHGGQCYLVHATAPANLNVQGTISHRRVRWRADSFNFVGFPVDPNNLPTFGTWFAGSAAHQSATRSMIYTLDTNDRWVLVARPESTLIQPDAAYWVFCQGASDYQGPLDVTVPLGVQDRANFGDVTETLSLKLANNLGTPLGVSLELAPTNALPLAYERKLLNLGEKLSVPLTAPVNFGPLEAGSSQSLRLTLDRAGMTQNVGGGVLIVRDHVGSLIRIPVTGKLP